MYRKMHIPDDPLFYEKYYFAPGESNVSLRRRSSRRERLPRVEDEVTRRSAFSSAGISGIPKPRASRHCSARRFCSIPLRSAGILRRRTMGPGAARCMADSQRAHAIANGVFVAAPNRVGQEEEEGTDGIEFFGHSFIADPFGRKVAEAGDR